MPLHLALALRKLDRTAEARDARLPIADPFATEWRIWFLLACYCCKLGQKQEALKWLGRAMEVAGKFGIRWKALDELDSASLWLNIAQS